MALEVDRSVINMGEELGHGQFGRVVLGHVVQDSGLLVRGQHVAVKYLNDDVPRGDREVFVQEAARMSALDHPHVIRLLAVCLQTAPQFIVLEHAVHGDVKTYLRLWQQCGSIVESATVVHQLSLCWGVLQGLEYLENVRYVHRDIAARNVLLDARFRAKIGDFGQSVSVLNLTR